MKNKKPLIIFSAVAILLAGLIGATGSNFVVPALGADQKTTITVNSAVTDATTFSKVTYTSEANQNFVLDFDAVKAGGGVGTIKGGSYVYRHEASRDLKSIKVDFTSTNGSELKVQSWYDKNDVVKMTEDLTSNTALNIRGNYFCLIAGDRGDVTINSITVDFGCLTAASVVRTQMSKQGAMLSDHCTMDLAFTWDDKVNNVSWFVIQLELKNDKDWDTIYPENKTGYLFGNDSLTPRLHIDEVRLLSSGRMQLFVNIFKQYSGHVVNGDFWPHLSFQDYYWTKAPADVKVSKYNNGNISTNGTTNQHGNGGIDGLGTYTCWSAWGMPCLTITRA